MLVLGDARRLPLKDASVQMVCTSPPYWNLRDYTIDGQIGLEPTPEQYVAELVTVFREVWRVLRPDGTLWLVLGDTYAGTNTIDRPLSTNGHRDHRGVPYGPSLKVRSGTDARQTIPPGLKRKDLIGIPWRVAFALQADGWYLRADVIWSKPNPVPESVRDRPAKAHEYVFLLAKAERYYYDGFLRDDDRTGRHRRSVWTIATQSYPDAHFATCPEALVELCIRAASREGDRVLDPFAGSGTVGAVCARHNRRFVGVELNPAYLTLAHTRTAQRALI